VPLYVLTDALDDVGIPSWAVAIAAALILFFALVFVITPGIKYDLTVTTDDGATVKVMYGEKSVSGKAVNGTVTLQVPLGADANIKISKNGCAGESMQHVMIDDYAFEKRLNCTTV